MKQKSKKKSKVFFLLLFIILFVFVIYLIPRTIKIKQVSCKTQYGACKDLISDKLNSIVGSNLISAKKAASGIAIDSTAEDFTVRFLFPDKLIVELVEPKPSFALKPTDEVSVLVNETGEVVGFSEKSALPTVLVEKVKYSSGDFVNTQELFALKLVDTLYYEYGITQGELKADGLFVDYSGFSVAFPLDEDVDILIASLGVILTKLKEETKDTTIDGVSLTQIDLRYKNPVIR